MIMRLILAIKLIKGAQECFGTWISEAISERLALPPERHQPFIAHLRQMLRKR